ncbi:MAG: DUF2125 domain-containing protein [Pseudomonadota bacterium]
MRRIILGLIGLAILAVGAWIAWWFIAANGQKAGLEFWLEQQRGRGWQAESAGIDATGFPGDVVLSVRDPKLADPNTGWSWQAPGVTAVTNPFSPTRIAVTWPGEQKLGLTDDQITLLTKSMTTLLDLRPGPSMELREAATAAQALVAKGRDGWTASADVLDVRLVERGEDLAPPNSYDLRGSAEALKLPKELITALDPTGLLKVRPKVDRVTLSGHAAFDDPIDRLAFEEGRLAVRAATIREAGFVWGDMKLVVRGAFKVDDQGYPNGDIQVEAEEWERLIELAISSGAIDDDLAETIRGAVKLVTAFSGGQDLSIPLGLSDGRIRIGPFAIADAPRLAPPR